MAYRMIDAIQSPAGNLGDVLRKLLIAERYEDFAEEVKNGSPTVAAAAITSAIDDLRRLIARDSQCTAANDERPGATSIVEDTRLAGSRSGGDCRVLEGRSASSGSCR